MIDGITSMAITNRPRIKVIFEFCAPKPKLTYYRGVQATDGGFRMEKRGLNAKRYKAFMWCGSIEGLYQHREAVEHWYECHPILPNNTEARAV